jgi:hypothetical protein
MPCDLTTAAARSPPETPGVRVLEVLPVFLDIWVFAMGIRLCFAGAFLLNSNLPPFGYCRSEDNYLK